MAEKELDVIPDQTKLKTEQDNVVVKAALNLLIESNDIKTDKEATVHKVKDYYNKLLSGEDPEKVDQLISYLPLILTNIFTTLYKVPDTTVIQTGYNDNIEILMSAFLEKVVMDAGFNDMMTTGFGGAHQAANYGNFYVLGMTGILDGKGKKIKKGENFVEFQGLGIGNGYFNREATQIRANYVSQDLSQFAVITEMNALMANKMFPGLLDKARIGRIPNSETEDNPTDQKTDEQRSFEERQIEIMYFYDLRNEVFSIIAGSNTHEFKRIEGNEFKKTFTMWFDGKPQIIIPVAGYGLEPRPEGIYDSGLPETFWRIIDLDSKLSTSLANNTLEGNYSPMLLNIENVDGQDLLAQVGRGKRERQRGNRAVIIPRSATKGQPVGQANVDYLRPNELAGENEKLTLKYESILRRMGWNVDFNFTDPTKTLGQSEIDIQGTTSKVSSIQANNKDFYKFIYWYAVDKIVKLGNEKDDTLWGGEVEVDVNGEIKKISELTDQPITIGLMVNLFKGAIKQMQINFDLKNGVRFNDTLERRKYERKLASAAEGSPEQLRALRSLSLIDGGGKLKMSDILGTEGQAPQQQVQQIPAKEQL